MEALETLVDTLHLEDLRNAIHPSTFDENEGYDMLIVRLPVIGRVLETESVGFVITPGNSYLYDRGAQAFEALGERFEGPHRLLDRRVDHLLKSFAQYKEVIEEMEETLYEDRAGRDFMSGWLGLKRDILHIERILMRTSGIMQEVLVHYEDEPSFPLNHYIDLHEHIDRVMRSATLHLSKLDYLHNFYNARTNEKMNRMIYILTIISAIFLPLNLLVGFFGMNTGGLPFAKGDEGTLKALLLMVSLTAAASAVIYLWRKKIE
jgi:magnesium transporter